MMFRYLLCATALCLCGAFYQASVAADPLVVPLNEFAAERSVDLTADKTLAYHYGYRGGPYGGWGPAYRGYYGGYVGPRYYRPYGYGPYGYGNGYGYSPGAYLNLGNGGIGVGVAPAYGYGYSPYYYGSNYYSPYGYSYSSPYWY